MHCADIWGKRKQKKLSLISDVSFDYIPTSLSKSFQPDCQSKCANHLFLMSEFSQIYRVQVHGQNHRGSL